MYYKKHDRDMKINKIFQNVHINILNSDFSVDNSLNATKSPGDVPCSTLEGSMSQNFE